MVFGRQSRALGTIRVFFASTRYGRRAAVAEAAAAFQLKWSADH